MNDSERMIVSAWKDGEVEAPWDARVAAKVASDPEWARESQRHDRVKGRLAADQEPSWTASQERVWNRLATHTSTRRIQVPWTWVSVAAAALITLAAGGGFWAGQVSAVHGNSAVADLKVQVPRQLELQLSGDGQLIMASTLQGTSP